MQAKRKAGTPSYHTQSARSVATRRSDATIIPLDPKPRLSAYEMRAREMFKLGCMCGGVAVAIVFLLVAWLWVIPTMDGAVATAQRAYEMAAGV